jgi:hypothetical protein
VLGKKGTTLALVAVLAAVVLPRPGATARTAATEPEVLSPTGQVLVVTVNARQIAVLDVRHFRRMLGLTVALRNRPPAWNGGFEGAVTAPDVIILQEISDSNLEIVTKLLKQRSQYKYELMAAPGSSSKFLVNLDTVTPQAEPETWTDPCFPGTPEKDPRLYQLVHFTEIASGLPFTVAGVHFYKNYSGTGQERCRERNTEEIRAQLADETASVIVGGDFNYRARSSERECDPNEESEPVEWWLTMTAPVEGGIPYLDAVYETNRRDGTSMENEWTHEQDATKQICTGETTHKRARIDYLFAARATVAEAHADTPGWAGEEPGSVDPLNKKYSDHRWVWGRFALAGLPAPQAITVTPAPGGDISVAWQAVEGAVEYYLYRAIAGHEFDLLAQIPGGTSSYTDLSGEDGTSYAYAVATVGADGNQGIETESSFVTSDASGPEVDSIYPVNGATQVPRSATIEVVFDEDVRTKSVGGGTIKITLNGRSVGGDVDQKSPTRLTFNPNSLLKKKKTYKITVRPVDDELGNTGNSFTSFFST